MSIGGRDQLLNSRRKYFQRLRCDESPAFPACEENYDSFIDTSPIADNDAKRGCSISLTLDKETKAIVEPSTKLAADSKLVERDSKTAEKIQLLVKKQQDIAHQEVETEIKTQALLMEEMSILTERLMESTKDVKFTSRNLTPQTLHLNPLISFLHVSIPQISLKVQLQNLELDLIKVDASKNMYEVDQQRQKMKEREKAMTSSIFSSIFTVLYVAAIFLLTYVVIRFFPKPAS
jgi:hypothetical protein